MLVVFLTFASFASVHVSLTLVTGPLTWTLKQVFLNSIQLTWTFIVRFLASYGVHVSGASSMLNFWRIPMSNRLPAVARCACQGRP